MSINDTIVALATPPGRSGIGVIRLSGSSSLEITRLIIADENFTPPPRRTTLKKIRDPRNAQVIDQALITYFKAPHSFTGEDVVELSCHGSPTLLLHVIDALLRFGARVAEAGEFTLRAVSNGQLDLSQAEAVRDLVNARTFAAVRQASKQLGGELSHRLQPVKDALLGVIVLLESSLEFVEDDLPPGVVDEAAQSLLQLAVDLKYLADTFRTGRFFTDGLRVTLVGRPNVGKSSLFNCLVARDRAIVTEVPGTTRDSLSELVDIDGLLVMITDTAGLHDSSDAVERLGIERTRRALADSDLIAVVLDGSQDIADEDLEIIAEVSEKTHLFVINKSDLQPSPLKPNNVLLAKTNAILVSAKTGFGIDALRSAILHPFTQNVPIDNDFLITDARHFDLLQRAANAISSSSDLLAERASEEICLVGLHNALRFLGEITGETTSDDILMRIFKTFCIGK
ncbi:MAG: tRNA uridine-5-carboxymethylaminomethyl(34) synthesis GTPase MnmE [Acidobacteriota bacterium]|nr:tRNA uridine-5-carboxymethylaminomethyl(34) synthesis GTPase MnmE [Acidobacteriota bacterium]